VAQSWLFGDALRGGDEGGLGGGAPRGAAAAADCALGAARLGARALRALVSL
jgi:hypothetical protein